MITIEDFDKVEIRVGTVLTVEPAEGADKLLRIVFDFGPLPVIASETKQSQKGEEIAEDSSSPHNDENNITILPDLAEKYPGRHVRQIMSAIRPFFEDPQVIVGKQICVITNLAPRKFRGYASQGMIMAVGDAATGITFISPEKPVEAGMKVK